MSSELLISLLQSKIDIGTFNRWISGDNVKEIDSRLSRSRFALHVLNYIQQSSSILFSSSRENLPDFKSNESKRTSSIVTRSNVHSKLSVEPVFSSNSAIRTPKDACSSENKSASNSSFFSPDLRTSPITQIPFNLDSSNESPIKNNNQANHQSPKNHSLHKYSIQHNYNKSKFPIYNSTPKDNDKTSESLTEKNVKSCLFFESSDSSSELHSVSSNFQAYDQNFPSLTNSRPKVINVKSKNAPNLTKDSSSSNSSLKSLNSSISSTNINQSGSAIYCNSPKLQARVNQRKRVNPTLVQKIPLRDFIKHEDTKTKKDTNFTKCDETTPQKSSPFQQSVLEEPRNNYNEERLILKEKRYGPKSNQQTIFPNIIVKSLITPEPNKVTYFNYIVCLANIYNSLLDYNFVPNLSAEIHFIFSLLTLKIRSENCVMKEQFVMGSNLCESEKLEQSTGKVPENFLNNIHNCVMFAVCVITSQIHLWRYLDRTTLKLLANNERLILFSSSFATDLNLLYQNKEYESTLVLEWIKKLTLRGNYSINYVTC
uniref:Uncharacterized protein n=1 Tax=Clastoptera arizonana TaxID=38151 RepID=A0A1B6DN82_9HEMI